MKKFFIALFIFAIAAASVFIGVRVSNKNKQTERDYLRIHVRANSNSEQDQKVKYEVKDEVVSFITPYVKECIDKDAAIKVMGGILKEIENVCDRALKERGYTYGARAAIRSERFPTRVYGDLTLEEGVYDALIIELGSGKGDNWWCVIYPPLCFTASCADVRYRSAIADIIKKWKRK